MLTLNDERTELWQWDTGRKLKVEADCSQVHFSNKVFGRSIDVDVVGGVAIIPDILLQTDKDLTAWAFVGAVENGYTKISKVFKVNKRNKPADYVFTPPEQTTLGQIMERLHDLEAMQDPDAIKNAVDDYLANNPIQIDEKDPTVPAWAKQETKPKYTATEVGAVATINGVKPDANGNVEITTQGSGGNVTQGLTAEQISALDGMFKVCAFTKADVSAQYNAFKTAFGIEDSGEEEPDVPVIPPDEPDEPDIPEVTLSSISATYSGGDVAVGTAVADLTGIVVTATYSDGSTETVTGYTLSGEIAEGSNTVTVSYNGKTTTFTVTGVAESGGDSADIHDGYISDGLEFRLDAIRNTESGHSSAQNYMVDVSGNGYAIENYQCLGVMYDTYLGPDGQNQRSSHRIIDYATILAKMATFTVEVVSQPIGTPNDNTILFSVGNGNQKTLLAANGRMRLNDSAGTAYGTADTDVSTIKHYTITYDGSNMNLYHEDVLDASQPATTDITTSEDCEFFSNKDWANHTNGYFNAARIYIRALTAAEVKANYDNDIARFGTVNVEVA